LAGSTEAEQFHWKASPSKPPRRGGLIQNTNTKARSVEWAFIFWIAPIEIWCRLINFIMTKAEIYV
jgi:hypothetical protein